MDELKKSTLIALSGMKTQSQRLRVVSENMANADSLPKAADQEPYRRKIVTFKQELDQQTGANLTKVAKVGVDRSDFIKKFDPKHPAADRDGYVMAPNVNPLIELMDMREAQRSYEANMNIVSTSRALMQRTIEMLR
ncbi:MAG: flagellar basal body rod protein FlgC [Alphaproteobacteria bacterium]|nr:flagellar basal body rod protein FlgC [Alphaproteobacteria bacterium]MBF0334286.1 flagellar basal body rod protein FlgC [Alphaproteobacteria bacterium]